MTTGTPTQDRAPAQDAPNTSRRFLSALSSESVKSTILPIAGLAILVVVFGVLASNFFAAQTVNTVLREASVLLVVAIGLTFVVLMGSIDLSVGAIVTLSGLVAAQMTETFEWGTAALIGILAGLAVGVVNGVIFAYLKVPSFLTTLGTSLAVGGIAQWYVGGRPVQVSDESFLGISQSSFLGNIPNIAIWALILWGLFAVLGLNTRFGRYMYAIGGGEQVSQLSGIPVRRYKFYAMVVSGALSGVAGILLTARVGAATPDMGNSLTLLGIAAVVIGGTALTGGLGGVHRTLLGVLVITVLDVGLNALVVPPYFQAIVQGAVVVLAVAVTLDRSKLSTLK